LKERGILAVPRYIQKPAFMCEVFQKQRTFGSSRYPFSIARPQAIDYRAESFPGTSEALERVLVIPWNDRYTTEDVEYIASEIGFAVQSLSAEYLTL
jgi:dTDP-4-amino-4,6-dideoxygalactose transaminase